MALFTDFLREQDDNPTDNVTNDADVQRNAAIDSQITARRAEMARMQMQADRLRKQMTQIQDQISRKQQDVTRLEQQKR